MRTPGASLLAPIVLLLLLAAVALPICRARRHHLEVRDDYRRYIALSTFGFYQGGMLDVRFGEFRLPAGHDADVFGLSLDRTMTDAMNPYLDSHQDRCILDERATAQRSGPIVFFVMRLREHKVYVNCSSDWPHAIIYKSKAEIGGLMTQPKPFESNLFAPLRRRRRDLAPDDPDVEPSEDELENEQANAARFVHPASLKTSSSSSSSSSSSNPNANKCSPIELPLESEAQPDGSRVYRMQFVMWINSKEAEGLYNLYFHACPNYRPTAPVALHFNVDIAESNRGSFLSAGEMPLPALYFMMSILFLLSGLFWVFILRKSKHTVFKIHYIMAVLVFLKSLSLMFHSINFHFIEVLGEHVETWAILFYIAHLLKGAVLFITIVLIGTGYTFIKHILSDKDKRLFMIVIPLQILANVAQIILAEGEEGDKEHRTWTHILYFVDLLCCGAILFPVVWSIRHLQEASATDGKAATNLRKLKLFRQFYIMIVCYIYVTRIVAYLLRITVAFQYGWLDEMFREMATYVFFVLTAYKFRPTGTHPYFAVAADEDVVYEEGDEGEDGEGLDGGEGGDGDAVGMVDGRRRTTDGKGVAEKESEAITRSGLLGGVRKTKSVSRSLLVPTGVTLLPLSTKHQADTVRLLDARDDRTADALLSELDGEDDDDDGEDHSDDADSNVDLFDAATESATQAQQRRRHAESARLIAKRESSHEYD